MSRALLGVLLAWALVLPASLAGCRERLTLQATSESGPVPDAVRPSERTAEQTVASASGAALLVAMSPGEGKWAFQTIPGAGSTYAIRVIDGRGEAVQTIDDLVSRPPFTAENLLDVRDFNADGYPDLLARTLPVGASAITGASLYVFDSSSRRFVESEGIDQEGEIAIESKGCITVEYRSDAMNYSKDHYCWKAGKWEFQRTTKD